MAAEILKDTFGRRANAYLTTPADFRKFREKLSRELLSLRHELNIVTRDTKNYRENEKISGISAGNYAENTKYGTLLLLLAERNLVHASEIKSVLETKGQQSAGHKKLLASKYKRALAVAKKLVLVTAAETDQDKRLELYVYAALIQGQFSISKKQWQDARTAYALARVGLQGISSLTAAKSTGDSSDVSAVEIRDTIVDPALKLVHAHASAAHKSSLGIDAVARIHCHDGNLPYLAPIVEMAVSADPALVQENIEVDIPRVVSWRLHEAVIDNDDLALKVHELQNLDKKIYSDSANQGAEAYSWEALIDMHQRDIANGEDADDLESTQNNAILLTFLKYHMLFWKINFKVLEASAMARLTSTAAIVEAQMKTLENYSEAVNMVEKLKDLPGVYNDEDLYESLEQLARLFELKRAALIADAYAAAKKLPEALKLYLHIERMLPGDGKYFLVESFPYEVSSDAQVYEFKEEVLARLASLHALTQHYSAAGNSAASVVENIRDYPALISSLNHITNVTKKGVVAPLLSKPVLFDVAFNYIGYRGEGEQASEKSSSAVAESDAGAGEKKKAGFFGIFGRG